MNKSMQTSRHFVVLRIFTSCLTSCSSIAAEHSAAHPGTALFICYDIAARRRIVSLHNNSQCLNSSFGLQPVSHTSRHRSPHLPHPTPSHLFLSSSLLKVEQHGLDIQRAGSSLTAHPVLIPPFEISFRVSDFAGIPSIPTVRTLSPHLFALGSFRLELFPRARAHGRDIATRGLIPPHSASFQPFHPSFSFLQSALRS